MRPAKPRTVKIALLLWIVAVVLQLASSMLTLLDLDQLRTDLLAEVSQGFPAESPVMKDRVVVAVLALLLGSGVLLALLQLGFASAMNKGKRWARLALVPLAAFGVVHAAIVFGALSSPLLAGLLAAAGVAVSAVVTSFLPASRVWFEGGRA
ncbi:hypothetical protein FKR81_36740 [Lentzea tibetensis]|uniref:Uncharacterized protein n=1 Tax=Lentzea tibetensis TaxID=2591470 RepID=A0A563EI87_9PSEU|nr:hypothetical protein [Lentzea tibetensis]TWP46284.1 hypothetical protein FKR81_36740 [Lentzea tibetensis]